MATETPFWLNPASYPADRVRRADAMALMTVGTGLGARSGIRPGTGGLVVTLAGSTISVAPGIAAVYVSGQGIYRVVLTSTATLTLSPADVTYGRVDLVYLRVWDGDLDGTGLYQGDVVYLPGTASATPAAPTPPAGQMYLPLGQITVPVSGGPSPTVADVRPITVAPGGIVPDPAATGYYPGQYRDNGSGLERYGGTTWHPASPLAPIATNQVSQPSYSTTGSYVDFTSGQWSPITFTVPASGSAWISVGAAVMNTVTTTATAWAAWRASGGYTQSPSEANGVSCWGSRTYATRRVLVTGMTPGASVTITPVWNVSSAGTPTTQTRVSDGQLSVEPVAG